MSPLNEVITTDNEDLGHVEEFTFLGSVVPGSESDIKRRIALSAAALGRLRRTVWNRRDIPRSIKIRLYKALLIPIATYASATWTMRVQEERMLLAFEMRCLQSICGVTQRSS